MFNSDCPLMLSVWNQRRVLLLLNDTFAWCLYRWLLFCLLVCFGLCSLEGARTFVPEKVDLIGDSEKWVWIEGFDARSVSCVDVGASGNVWIGREGRVSLYDGKTFKDFGQEEGLSGEKVRLIKETRSGEVFLVDLWHVFRLVGGQWKKISDLSSSPSQVWYFGLRAVEAEDGTVWFANGRHLVSIRGSEVRESRLVGRNIQDMTIDSQGQLWGLESKGDVVCCWVKDGRVRVKHRWRGLMRRWRTKSIGPGRIEATSDGRIWVFNPSERDGLFYLEPNSQDWVEVDLEKLGGSRANFSIIEPEPGVVLLSGAESLFRWENGDWHVYDKISHKLPMSYSTMLSDRRGWLWLWLQGLGLYRIDYGEHRWSCYAGLNFQCEWKGQLRCFINEGGSVVMHNVEQDVWTAFGEEDGVIDNPVVVVCNAKGEFWAAGSHGNTAAVSWFDGLDWTRLLVPELGSLVNYRAAWAASDGAMLFGMGKNFSPKALNIGGLVQFSERGGVYEKERLFAEPRRVDKLWEIRAGELVYSNKQLYLMENDKIRAIRLPLSFQDSGVEDFAYDQEGGLWVVNWGQGVIHCDGGKWRNFSFEDGLDSPFAGGVAVTSTGDIFVLTVGGLSRFDGDRWRLIKLPHYSGLRDRANLKHSGDGGIWVNVVCPSWFYRKYSPFDLDEPFYTIHYSPDVLPPNTSIELVGGKDRYSGIVRARWSAVDPWAETPSHKLEYSYRIGESGWSAFSSDTSQDLLGLEVGAHVVEVRARDTDGNIDPTPASAIVTVAVPFWHRPWFLYFSFIVAVAVGGLAIALYVQRMRHRLEIDRVRLRFLTNISHEIRTPLALILWPLEKYLREFGRGAEHGDLGIVLRNAKRLNRLIEQLLDYRKVEVDQLDVRLQSGDIVRFFTVIIEDFGHLAALRGQSVILRCEEREYRTQFDEDILRKIIDNLVLNALKFSPKGSKVSVVLQFGSADSFGDGCIRLTVEDEGPGIEPDTAKHIFEPFYSGRHQVDKSTPSYGVGLALVNQLVALLGGSISVDSPTFDREGEKRGSRFTVELPKFGRLGGAEAGKEMVDVEGAIVSDEVEKVPLGGEVKGVGDHRMLILLVDDNEELREFVASELKDEYSLILAEDGEDALRKASEQIPDLVLSDVMMPKMDGVQFCRALRDNVATSHVPVILQTSFATDVAQDESLGAGAIDYLARPFSISHLKARIRSHLESRVRYADYLSKRLSPVSEALHPSASDDQEVQFIEQVREKLEASWDCFDFNAEKLAAEFGMGRSTFYGKFKAVTNQSPAEAIKCYRLEKAACLIVEGESISEVSYRIGYADSSSFYPAFKKHFGCTPAEYRVEGRKGMPASLTNFG